MLQCFLGRQKDLVTIPMEKTIIILRFLIAMKHFFQSIDLNIANLYCIYVLLTLMRFDYDRDPECLPVKNLNQHHYRDNNS